MGKDEHKSKSDGCKAVVAVGASAGGLDPLEAFFTTAPADRGWCYVVLQHLSPDYRSVMDELLGRKSSLTIKQIDDGQTIEPNTIFLNRPNSIVELDGDTFRVTAYADGDDLPHLPIDAFFKSLAKSSLDGRVAVVLSGSGSDGARGAEALQGAGGYVLVQSPKEAKFSSMPKAALSTGAVDKIEDASALPKAVANLLDELSGASDRKVEDTKDPWQAILRMIEVAHRIDFSVYKSPTVLRRIERRMGLKGIESIEDYRDLLRTSDSAVEELYQDMLIGVTEFYRDTDAMASLSRNAIAKLVADKSKDDIRVWVAACATGEEAYTIAIELSEAIRTTGSDKDFRIIASDVHRGSISRAGTGIYPESALKNVSEAIRKRYFVDHRDGVQIDQSIRQKVIFSVQNALADPPFMRLDLVSCRNLMIYLNDEAQTRLLSMFLFGLKKNGYLYLGASESLGALKPDFEVIDSTWRLFRKQTDRRVFDSGLLATKMGAPEGVERFDMPRKRPQSRPPLTSIDKSDRSRVDRDSLLRGYDALLKRYAPSSILITDDGKVLTWFGAASAYIDTMSDLAERTVEEIVHPSLQYAINLGAERLRQGPGREFEREVEIEQDAEEPHKITVRVEPLMGAERRGRFLLVSLRRRAGEDANESVAEEAKDETVDDNDILSNRIRELERDLRLTDESLQYVTERLETSGEELQASNEELQASNEELQAANEELQASNEELHAVNEELVSVSAEHERKIDLLSNLNHDIELAFSIIGVGLLILDQEMRIQRFTKQCGEILKLVEHDNGRKIDDVGSRLDFVNHTDLAHKALKTGERQHAEGETHGETMTVTAVPTEEKGDKGVVVVFAKSLPTATS